MDKRLSCLAIQDNQIRNVSLQSDGKLLVAGHYYNGANATRFAIARSIATVVLIIVLTVMED